MREAEQDAELAAAEFAEAAQSIDDATARGDIEGASYAYEVGAEILARAEQAKAKLEALKPRGLSPAKQKWLADRWDLPQSQQMTQLATQGHAYVTQRMGLADDSPEYFQAMGHYLEAPGYQKPITPNQVCETLKLDPDEYNRQCDKLSRLKQSGSYND